MGVSNRWPSSISELISRMEMRMRAPVTRGYFFSSALCASLTRVRCEISIRKKYPLEPRVTEHLNDFNNYHKRQAYFIERSEQPLIRKLQFVSTKLSCSKCILFELKALYFRTYHIVRTPYLCWNQAFYQCYFVLWLELQAVVKAAERQIEVLGDVRSTQGMEIIVIDQCKPLSYKSRIKPNVSIFDT